MYHTMGKDRAETTELSAVKIVVDKKDNAYASVSVYRKGSEAPSAELDVRMTYGAGKKGTFRYVLATPHKNNKKDGIGFEVHECIPSPKHPPTIVSIIADGEEVAVLEFSLFSRGLSHHYIATKVTQP